jgi:hypothetical protein
MQSDTIIVHVPQPKELAKFRIIRSKADWEATRGPSQAFELDHAPLDLGNCAFEKWWIDTRKLRPTRNRKASMYNPIVETYWNMCRAGATNTEDAVQESYLLAKLLPHIPDNKVREVFLDSCLYAEDDWTAKTADVQLLQEMLDKGFDSMTVESFHIQTANLLGPSPNQNEDEDLYAKMTEQLLDRGRELLTASHTDEAVTCVRKQWDNWYTTIHRAKKKEEQKRIYTMLGYECKAAFHRAYSAVWQGLIHCLCDKYNLSLTGARFHQLWHLDQIVPSSDYPGLNAHLFHGHVFALHPATGPFMQTSVGQRLVGNWLIEQSRESYELLLGGLYVAMAHYFSVHKAN